jgi:hypothetical protein
MHEILDYMIAKALKGTSKIEVNSVNSEES